jgi:ribosomal protein S18 acetylase RimI-like enzyme
MREMGDVMVRLGRPEDEDAAVAVYLASNDARRGGRPTPPHHVERVRRNIRSPDAILLVAEDAGACVGMALAMQSRADGGTGLPVPGLCFISMIFVAPDRWGEGIGGRIVDDILAEAGTRGYETAQLWTHADNDRSHRLYEARGFRRTGRDHDDDLGDRIVQYERTCR